MHETEYKEKKEEKIRSVDVVLELENGSRSREKPVTGQMNLIS